MLSSLKNAFDRISRRDLFGPSGLLAAPALRSTHQGDFASRDFAGSISGDEVHVSSNVGEVHGAALSYRFDGKLNGDTISGTVEMGEYLGAKWTAKRHAFPA